MDRADGQADPGAWYRPASVHLVGYDGSWPAQYEAEATLIIGAIGDDLAAIEHVGSTAVPGMPAKPIIDILASVFSWDRFDSIVAALVDAGYIYTEDSESSDPDRRVFRKGSEDMSVMRTHHLHLTEVNSFHWRRMIAFRDRLLHDAAEAAAYAALKARLAKEFATDSRGYTRAKADFVKRIEAKPGSA